MVNKLNVTPNRYLLVIFKVILKCADKLPVIHKSPFNISIIFKLHNIVRTIYITCSVSLIFDTTLKENTLYAKAANKAIIDEKGTLIYYETLVTHERGKAVSHRINTKVQNRIITVLSTETAQDHSLLHSINLPISCSGLLQADDDDGVHEVMFIILTFILLFLC